MAKRVATNVELKSINSHWFSTDHKGLSKEELYGHFTATWLGKEVEFRMQASRYVFNDGDWSDWRIYVDGGAHTDTMRTALNEAGRDLFEEYIRSVGYLASRRAALADTVRRVLRDERYNVDRAERALNLVRDELTVEQVDVLTDTIEALERFLSLLDASLTASRV